MDDLVKRKERLDLINLIFAFLFCTIPFWSMVFNVAIMLILIIFSITYLIFLIFHLPYLTMRGGIKDGVKKWFNFPNTIATVLFIWLIVSASINGVFGEMFMIYVTYFIIYICFMRVDNKHYKKLLYLFFAIVGLSIICGFFDPAGNYIASFHHDNPYSLQFYNSNYSGYLVATLLILVIILLHKVDKTLEKVYLSVIFTLFGMFLYANGSFVPITAVHMFAVIYIVYYWIRYRKCPWQVIVLWLVYAGLGGLIEVFTNFVKYRQSAANYYVECIAVFKHIFNIGSGGKEVPGADGWDRLGLIKRSLGKIFGSTHTFIVGDGAGAYSIHKPHLQLIALWLDFGIVAPLLYTTLIVYLIVRFIKQKLPHDAVLPMFAVGITVVMSFFGSMTFYSFAFFVPILAATFKETNKQQVTD